MGRVPPEFEIRSLDKPPTEYASRRVFQDAAAFPEVLGRVLV